MILILSGRSRKDFSFQVPDLRCLSTALELSRSLKRFRALAFSYSYACCLAKTALAVLTRTALSCRKDNPPFSRNQLPDHALSLNRWLRLSLPFPNSDLPKAARLLPNITAFTHCFQKSGAGASRPLSPRLTETLRVSAYLFGRRI